jgi:hypothetical protein
VLDDVGSVETAVLAENALTTNAEATGMGAAERQPPT